VIKNKAIILPFLFLAWTIIFAHSIVPHNHHDTFHETKCLNNHHEHNTQSNLFAEIHDCDSDCGGHVCHFHVDVLTQVSIDNIFIINNESQLFNSITYLETNRYNFYNQVVSDADRETNYLRGPPSSLFS
jgi:hypothetical protein